MNCVYCHLHRSHVRQAEYTIQGMSLCGEHFHQWEEGTFEIEDIEKGNFPDDEFPDREAT